MLHLKWENSRSDIGTCCTNQFDWKLIRFVQVSTCTQSTATPLWNEILRAPVPSLPCYGTVRFEVACAVEQFLDNITVGVTFGFILTESLEHGFSDEWLVGAKINNQLDDPGNIMKDSNTQLRLRVSCSFNQDLVQTRQRGLWPSQDIEPSQLTQNPIVKLSELMLKTPLVYRQRLKPPSADGSRAWPAQALCSRNSPTSPDKPPSHAHTAPLTALALAASEIRRHRDGPPSRMRPRVQRRLSEVVGMGFEAFFQHLSTPQSAKETAPAQSRIRRLSVLGGIT